MYISTLFWLLLALSALLVYLSTKTDAEVETEIPIPEAVDPPVPTPPQVKRKYTWKRDTLDPKDKLFSVHEPLKLSAMVDLSVNCPPVYDQGELGSCTANALAAAMEYAHTVDSLQAIMPSRLFIYYNERVIEQTVNEDSGAMIRDGAQVLRTRGAPPEALWPYDIQKFTAKPPKSVFTAALPNRITSYYRVTSFLDLLQCLAIGYPVVFGFDVYESFESQQVAATGIVNMPAPNEQCLGGHAVLAVGYDMASSRIKVRNSWGPNWGQQGYFTMPFDYFTTPGFATDFWTFRK